MSFLPDCPVCVFGTVMLLSCDHFTGESLECKYVTVVIVETLLFFQMC